MGRLPEAISVYQTALQIDPRNEPGQIGLGESYGKVFNYVEARRWMEECARQHPRSVAPLLALADLELELQHHDDAIASLQRALRIEPSNAGARALLAGAYYAKGDLAPALEEAHRAVAAGPRAALSYYLRASIHADRNENELALADARKALKLQPENPRALVLLGKLQVRMGKCSEAAATLEALKTVRGEDTETLFLLARAYQCAGQSELARQTTDRFAELSRQERVSKENKAQAENLFHQANELARKNQLSAALELLRQALEKDPRNANAYAQLAKIYLSQGEIARAREAVGQALEISPNHPEYLYVLGRVLERQGNLQQALQAFEHSVLVNPQESDSYYEMGMTYLRLGDRTRALEALRKAVAIAPEDADYQRALAEASRGAAAPRP
jgi:tetratricopeptide (TPR) repeat protein